MPEPTASRVVTVVNTQGLHARPADLFARQASRFQSRIEIVKGNECVDGKSVLGILTLGAQQGVELTLKAVGDDAEEAIAALAELIERELIENEKRMAEEEGDNGEN
ncbi:MAG: HPr family phosphocarrier protein [Planctomycetes bacterium]|nr:HPr family phosphocarrier protein [Planctomycetota bacterium]